MYRSSATQTGNTSKAISVSELNRQARNLLERSFLNLRVVGEISNFVRPSSGHWYFTLKDNKAQIRCAMFRNRNQLLRTQPKQGDKVVVNARVSLYEGRGDYQLICEYLELDGSGALQQAFEELKHKLHQEGLFDKQHKRPLPEHPRQIGVITSQTGAAIHDILTVLKRRFPGLPVTLYPTAVQGTEAAAQICRALALAEADDRCDVLIVGRGGGSLEDLWPFNEESVARTIFNCSIPVISAVGHEVDVVISDYIADHRAATPSAAAELVSPDQQEMLGRLKLQENRLQRALQQRIAAQKFKLQQLKARLQHPGQRLREQSQRLDQLEIRLKQAVQNRLQQQTERLKRSEISLQAHSPKQLIQVRSSRLDNLKNRLLQQIRMELRQQNMQLHATVGRLNTVSPLATLERGYAIVKDQQGNLLRSAKETQVGAQIETQLGEGRLLCTVNDIDMETV